MYRTLRLFVLGLLVIGCTSKGATFSGVPDAPASQGLLVMYWKPGFSGQLYTARFNLGEQKKIRLRNGSFAITNLPPGDYALKQSKSFLEIGKEAALMISITAGKPTYVEYTQNMSDFLATGSAAAPFVITLAEGLAEVTETHALRQLEGLKQVATGDDG